MQYIYLIYIYIYIYICVCSLGTHISRAKLLTVIMKVLYFSGMHIRGKIRWYLKNIQSECGLWTFHVLIQLELPLDLTIPMLKFGQLLKACRLKRSNLR